MFSLYFSRTSASHETLAARLTDDCGTITTYRHKNDRLNCCRKSDNNGGKNKERATNRSKKRHLNIRAFTDNQKREAYERQKGICPVCTEHYEIGGMEGDHITPWHLGGKTSADNCQMLCKDDNRRKSGK